MASENSALTVVEKPWLFKPGQTGNPGGRPKGLAALVREQTADGADLVAFLVRAVHNKRLPMRIRLEACAQLLDRCYGKALQQTELSGPGAEPLTIRIEYGESTRDADAHGHAP
jgi:hypothetical protein